MVNFTILAGGYSSFIASYVFNSVTDTLSLTGQSTSGQSPSWISISPHNKSVLYATNSIALGAVQAFQIGLGGNLTLESTTSSGGDDPPYTAALNSGEVAVVNYNSGTGKIIPTTKATSFGSADTIIFPANVSHPHMVLQHGSEVLVPDLGADKVWRLGRTKEGWKIHGFVQQPDGSGPRHIAVQDDHLFTLHELSSTLTSQLLPPAPNGTSSIISNFSIIPPNPPAGSKFAAAEILYPPPDLIFPHRHIYVSNRNTGMQDPRGDVITIFSATRSGKLAIVDYVYTGLNQTRGMQLGGPDLRYLVAGGFGSGGVSVFERTNGGANLVLRARNLDLPTRTSFVWLE